MGALPPGCKPILGSGDGRCCGQVDSQGPDGRAEQRNHEVAAWAVLDDGRRKGAAAGLEAEAWGYSKKEPRDGKGSGEQDPNQVLLKYSDTSTYKGQAVDGKRHGEGVWTSATAEYEGQWKDDLQDGFGRQVLEDGRYFTGQFRRGAFHGRGRMEWRTESGTMVYEGEYAEDSKHGRGRFMWGDGRCYDGEWRYGQRSGHGRYLNSKGEMKKGIWKDDKLERWIKNKDDLPRGDSQIEPPDELLHA